MLRGPATTAIIAFLFSTPGVSQSVSEMDPVPEPCGSSVRDEEVAALLELEELGIYDGAGSTALRGGALTVPLTFHVVRRSDGTGGLSEARLATALADANDAFAGAGIGFFQCMETQYINNDEYYFNTDTGAEFDALRNVNPIPGTINIYFVPNLPYCGLSSFSTSSVQGIIMLNSCTATSSNHSTFPHEIGHYFNLYHTHETAFGEECTSGTNCGSTGDLVCDTPADPRLGSGNVNSSCFFTGTGTGPCAGDPGYAPDPRNYMSYSRKSCRDRFSSAQESRARATLVNLRPELLSGCIPPVLLSVGPSSGPLRGGTLVTLTGDHFANNARVWFDDTLGTVVQRIAETSLIARAPEGLTEGQLADVRVSQVSGADQLDNVFTYLPNEVSLTFSGSSVLGRRVTLTIYGPAGSRAGLGIGVAGETVKPCCTFCLASPIALAVRPTELTLGPNGKGEVSWEVEGEIFETKHAQGVVVTPGGPVVTNCQTITVFP